MCYNSFFIIIILTNILTCQLRLKTSCFIFPLSLLDKISKSERELLKKNQKKGLNVIADQFSKDTPERGNLKSALILFSKV